MSKDQFVDWKTHPATEFIMAVYAARLDQGRDELEAMAGENPILDAKRTGKLSAIRDFLSISWEDLVDD